MSSGREAASEKIGLDYLIESARSSGTPVYAQTQSYGSGDVIDTGLRAFAAKTVLKAVEQLELNQDKQDKGVRLSAISEKTGMSAVLLVPISAFLQRLNLIEVLERTSFGDDHVRLTRQARELLENDEVLLMERLGLT